MDHLDMGLSIRPRAGGFDRDGEDAVRTRRVGIHGSSTNFTVRFAFLKQFITLFYVLHDEPLEIFDVHACVWVLFEVLESHIHETVTHMFGCQII